MTIHELNALTALTSTDELPVWDAEASGEPTKKITASNVAASVKSLGSLIGTGDLDSTPTQGSNKAVTSGGVYTAIQQSTATTTTGIYRSNSAGGHGASSSNIVVKQYGNVVSIQGFINNIGAIDPTSATQRTLGTISNVKMPPTDIRTVAKIATNAYSNGDFVYCSLAPESGNISVTPLSTIPAGRSVTISITYVAD